MTFLIIKYMHNNETNFTLVRTWLLIRALCECAPITIIVHSGQRIPLFLFYELVSLFEMKGYMPRKIVNKKPGFFLYPLELIYNDN
jgi:hypothetical protein